MPTSKRPSKRIEPVSFAGNDPPTPRRRDCLRCNHVTSFRRVSSTTPAQTDAAKTKANGQNLGTILICPLGEMPCGASLSN